MKKAGIFLPIFLSLLLTGCISVFPDPPAPSKRVMLAPSFKMVRKGPKVPWQLVIEKPLANEILNSTRLVVTHYDAQGVKSMDYVAGVEWHDRLPRMLQEKIIAAFESSGRIMGVGQAEENFRAPYSLQLDIRHFEVEVREADRKARAFIEISAKIISAKTQKVEAQKTFLHYEPTHSHSLKAFLEAYESALDLLFGEIVQWTLNLHKGNLVKSTPGKILRKKR